MNSMQTDQSHVAATIRPEAAAWMARLQAPARDARTEQTFRQWLDTTPGHQEAFSEVTDIWQAVDGAARSYRKARRQRLAASLAAVFVFALCGIVFNVWNAGQPGEYYQTQVGEQRFAILDDGSHLTLNTNSRVNVHYSNGLREVTLVHGEALFDVAKDAGRPFIVHVDEREIRALGTSFVVYKSSDSLDVTLFEGKVSVGPHMDEGEDVQDNPRIVVLEPGQHWSMKSRTVEQLSSLQLDTATQWRRQEVVFNDTPLVEAVAEMNRYTESPMIITDARLDGRSVSGVFRIGDTDSFISTITALYGVTITRGSPAP